MRIRHLRGQQMIFSFYLIRKNNCAPITLKKDSNAKISIQITPIKS